MLFSNRTANKKRIDYHNMQLAKLEDELSSSASFRLAMANAVWKECQ